MTKTLESAYRESSKRDIDLIESLAAELRKGLELKRSLPLKKYAQCIAAIADSMCGILERYEEIREANDE